MSRVNCAALAPRSSRKMFPPLLILVVAEFSLFSRKIRILELHRFNKHCHLVTVI